MINLRVVPTRNGGAGERIRTSDLLFTKQLLYQLSYSGNKKQIVVNR